ncbi:T9SS type A sorting domain-containing protein [candidate division WOR-3 bacterium]|nr:T9SS type A sorting domain-containing protein [candidate division WOR-3 bacterium]
MRPFLLLMLAGAALADWTPRRLVGSYPDWDYWWLNVRLAIDRTDTLYCAVSRYNYSNSDPEHDLYVLDTGGDTVRVTRPWHGYEYQPIVQDAAGRNIYVGQPLLGMYVGANYHMDAGVTDDSNCVLTINSQGNDSIYFTKLGPSGQRQVWRALVYAGDPWVGRTSLCRDPRGWLHMTSEDGVERLVCCRSTDAGGTWSCETLQTIRVMSHVRCAATPDTCLHVVFRTWTGGVQLRYLKLGPDGSVMVGASVFSEGSERWEPTIALDTAGDVRVVCVDNSQNARNLYYTVLRGDLNTGGQPVPDSVLTLVPDTVIQTDPVRIAGPKIVVDSRNWAHVVFEQGVYGSGGDKYVYHIAEAAGQGVATERPGRHPGLELSPNPAADVVRVRLGPGLGQAALLQVFDAAGRVVLSRKPGAEWLDLDLGGLSSGVYVVRAGQQAVRLVKQR